MAGLFSPYTKRGRALRTFLQALLAILSFSLGLITIPGFGELLVSLGVEVSATALAAWIGVISYLYNQLESTLNKK